MTTAVPPSHEFPCRIVTPPNSLQPFLCRLWLPGEIDDQGALEFTLPRDAYDLLVVWQVLDLEGWREGHDGKRIETLRLPGVQTGGFVARHLDATTVVLDVKTVPSRIEILRERDVGKSVFYTFFLTEMELLLPSQSLVDSYTGETLRHGVKECIFVRSGEFVLTLDAHFTYKDVDTNVTNRTRSLVATCELPRRIDAATVESSLIPRVDLLLRLASMAARRRSACYRWQEQSDEHSLRVFRHDISRPQNKPSADSKYDEPLVPRKHLGGFLQVAMDKFSTLPDPSLIGTALARMPPRFPTTLEAEFLRLFAALESLLLWYRIPKKLDFVLPPASWSAARQSLKDAIEPWTKAQPELATDAARRGWLYRKLGELNRIPLVVAFEGFVADYSVDLGDLWPVFGSSVVSLSSIRNRIIHGVEAKKHELTAYSVALENLRWTVERIALSLLGWPIEASLVTPRHLSTLYAYRWRNHEPTFPRDDT